jgi:hypothetical protein
VTGARCPLTKPVVTAVELQATTEPHCSRGVQPGGIYVRVGTARADSRRSGVGALAPRPQALPMPATALILYIYICSTASACSVAFNGPEARERPDSSASQQGEGNGECGGAGGAIPLGGRIGAARASGLG